MSEYRHGAHTVFKIHLHLVWTTKYRKPVMTGEVGLRVRELIGEICGALEVEIIKGHVSRDHVHLFVSVPPKVTARAVDANVEREKFFQTDAGIHAFAAEVLGQTSVGKRLFLRVKRECDR